MATYGSVAGVQALIQTPTLSATTAPTEAQVAVWLVEGYSKINRAIANAGYTVPVADSSAIYSELSGLNSLYAAALVLRATGLDVVTGEGESRSEVWLADFYGQLTDLARSNLAALGVTVTATTTTSRRRMRTVQLRRVDGYSAAYGESTIAYDGVSE